MTKNADILNKNAKVVVVKVKVARKEDLKLGNPNKAPNINGASSSKNLAPIFVIIQRQRRMKDTLSSCEVCTRETDPSC